MKRFIAPCAGLAIAAVFLLYRATGISLPFSAPHEAVVRKVIDGDTIEISRNCLIRYIGIDTPEIRYKQHGVWIEAPQTFAQEAKTFNERLVLGKKILITYDQEKKDKYGRLLGYVEIDGIFVNRAILAEGLGFLMTIEPNTMHTPELYQALREAKKSGKGLWDVSGHPFIDAARSADFVNTLGTVCGQIMNVTRRSKMIFLNFSDQPDRGFTGVIFPKTFPIPHALQFCRNLQGKRVSITGIIKEYNGPEIIISSPEQIEIERD